MIFLTSVDIFTFIVSIIIVNIDTQVQIQHLLEFIILKFFNGCINQDTIDYMVVTNNPKISVT